MTDREALALANYYATMSCSRWNKSLWEPETVFGKFFKSKIVDRLFQFFRWCYRRKYWEMSRAALEAGEHRMWLNILTKRDRDTCYNTYPWPYCVLRFANWSESNNPEDCSLVLDPSGFPVKHCESYCAWKICEFTGKWLKAKITSEIKPKNWQYYLSLLGYNEVTLTPDPGYRYVGIDPLYDECGLVFWYERKTVKGGALVSTYRNKEFTSWIIKEEDIPYNIWVRID